MVKDKKTTRSVFQGRDFLVVDGLDWGFFTVIFNFFLGLDGRKGARTELEYETGPY